MTFLITSNTEVSPGTQPALNVLGGSGPCSSFGSVIKINTPSAICLEETKPTETHAACQYGVRPGICTEGNFSVCTRF